MSEGCPLFGLHRRLNLIGHGHVHVVKQVIRRKNATSSGCLFSTIKNSCGMMPPTRFSLMLRQIHLGSPLSPPQTWRKELSKIPCAAGSSAVSSHVPRIFGEKFASRGREENIKLVWYFLPREANSSLCAANMRIWLSQANRSSNYWMIN